MTPWPAKASRLVPWLVNLTLTSLRPEFAGIARISAGVGAITTPAKPQPAIAADRAASKSATRKMGTAKFTQVVPARGRSQPNGLGCLGRWGRRPRARPGIEVETRAARPDSPAPEPAGQDQPEGKAV